MLGEKTHLGSLCVSKFPKHWFLEKLCEKEGPQSHKIGKYSFSNSYFWR